MSRLAIIVAANGYGGIGLKGDLPWRLEGDLAQFREKTMGQVVIIGRSTDQSIPRRRGESEYPKLHSTPLPGRIVITVTSQVREPTIVDTDYWFVPTFDDAVCLAKSIGRDTVFFAGGKRVYEQALKIAEYTYLTYVYRDTECDVHVDGLDLHTRDDWEFVKSSQVVTYVDPIYQRRRPSHGYHEFKRKPT